MERNDFWKPEGGDVVTVKCFHNMRLVEVEKRDLKLHIYSGLFSSIFYFPQAQTALIKGEDVILVSCH